MRNFLRYALSYAVVAGIVVVASYARSQTCIVPAPVAPPTPLQLIVFLPADGGTTGCEISAFVSPNAAMPNRYPISNAKCSTSVNIAKQAAANDNGWNDGGSP